MIEQISIILSQITAQVGLLGIFIATVVESFFPPIPSEIILFTAGYTVKSTGGIELLLAVSVVGALGNFVGTLPFYLISRYGAESFLPNFIDKYGKFLLISRKDLKRGEELFEKHGNLLVFTSRLIPAIRSLVAFPAGIAKMHLGKYFLYSMAGSTIWNLFLSSVGYVAFEYKDQILAIIKPIEVLVLAILVLATLYYLYKVYRGFREASVVHNS